MTYRVRVTINRPALEIAIVRRNLSRKTLAYELGVSHYYLGLVLSGKIEPSGWTTSTSIQNISIAKSGYWYQ